MGVITQWGCSASSSCSGCAAACERRDECEGVPQARCRCLHVHALQAGHSLGGQLVVCGAVPALAVLTPPKREQGAGLWCGSRGRGGGKERVRVNRDLSEDLRCKAVMAHLEVKR